MTDALDITSAMPPVSIAVIGLGLIGGSLAEALAAQYIPVLGYDPAFSHAIGSVSSLTDSREVSVDFPGRLYNSLEELLSAAQQQHSIIVVAVPYPHIAEIFQKIAEHTRDILLTDVTSIKAPVHILAKKYGLNSRFVGGHPMAGTQNSGWLARNPALFHRKKWVLTLEEDDLSSHPQFLQWQQILDQLGTIRISLSPAEHDTAVASISHLPHILAEILATQGVAAGTVALQLAAGSFADGTRVAHTLPELVQAMLEANKTAILPLLDHTIQQLKAYRSALSQPEELHNLLAAGQAARLAYEDIQNSDDS